MDYLNEDGEVICFLCDCQTHDHDEDCERHECNLTLNTIKE